MMMMKPRQYLYLFFLSIALILLSRIRSNDVLKREIHGYHSVPLDNDISIFPEKVDHLLNMARRKQFNNTIVLVYASFSYAQPLFNWLIPFKKVKKDDNLLLICLDDTLYDLLRKVQIECLKLRDADDSPTSGDLTTGKLDKDSVKSLWVARVIHILRLLRANINVIVSDTDAIWLKDVTPILLNSGDIVASRANFPYDSPWGATLCMGLAYFHAIPAVIDLAEIALKLTIETQDDQIGFNQALFTLPSSQTEETNKLVFGRKILPNGINIATTKLYVHKLHPIVVTLLPHPVIPRYCNEVAQQNWKNVAVAHCHVNDGKPAPTQKHKGNQATHTAMLVKYNLYFLRDDWQSRLDQGIKQNQPLSSILQSISDN